MLRGRGPTAIAALAVAFSCALAACSANSSEPAGTTAAKANCRPTNGEEPQGTAFAGEAALSSVKLGPGPAITPEEAAREAPARRGTPLLLSGTVYAADCRTPLAGAVINVWQTDAEGVYGPGRGTSHSRCCYLQGTVKTASDGRYTIETIQPGHYRGDATAPPAHIHIDIHYRGTGLLTEVLFAGDPNLPTGDPSGEVIRLRVEGKRKLGRFDIVLATPA